MVRPRGLEPPRDLTPTATSTLRVYRFRHGRKPECFIIGNKTLGFPIRSNARWQACFMLRCDALEGLILGCSMKRDCLALSLGGKSLAMDWLVSTEPVEYETALAQMEARVAAIRAGSEQEAVWLLEHPALYTAGTSAKADDLLDARFPVYQTGRGGEYTYHGPGQRVAYAMLDLKKRQSEPDIKRYVWSLEEWIIRSLASLGVVGERREGRVGIWVVDPKDGLEKKIAALGVRVRHWVTFHGVSINVSPDLSHFDGIVPCGLASYGVTSLKNLGVDADMQTLNEALREAWSHAFP